MISLEQVKTHCLICGKKIEEGEGVDVKWNHDISYWDKCTRDMIIENITSAFYGAYRKEFISKLPSNITMYHAYCRPKTVKLPTQK